jgi:hypothetical protein
MVVDRQVARKALLLISSLPRLAARRCVAVDGGEAMAEARGVIAEAAGGAMGGMLAVGGTWL